MRTRVALAGWSLAVLVALGLTGCAADHGVVASLAAASPTPTATAPTTAEARAHTEAVALLRTAILPADARPTGAIASSSLSSPFESVGCKSLVDVSRFAIISDSTVQAVLAGLRSGPDASRFSGYGTTTQNGRLLSAGVVEGTWSTHSVMMRLAPLPGGDVGVRLDAQVVPDGASCARTGVVNVGATATP
ncbi:MAG TPA: hypothetical protein VGI56_07220 [Galbitalea sp.]|jgi:hypothetical protein